MRIAAIIAVVLLLAAGVWAQPANKERTDVNAKGDSAVRSSAAYAELVLFRTELQSELESLVLEYTDEYPRVVEIRQTLIFVERESNRLMRAKISDSTKLPLALGKLLVRKTQLETDHWKLQKNYKDEHPDVKRAKRKVEIFETAIAEILN